MFPHSTDPVVASNANEEQETKKKRTNKYVPNLVTGNEVIFLMPPFPLEMKGEHFIETLLRLPKASVETQTLLGDKRGNVRRRNVNMNKAKGSAKSGKGLNKTKIPEKVGQINTVYQGEEFKSQLKEAFTLKKELLSGGYIS